MKNSSPVRFAPHLNPRLFTPHLALIAVYCAFVLVGSYLRLSSIALLGSMVLVSVAAMPRHSIVVDDTTVRIRHWLWTWRLNRDDITEVSWDERERYLTVGHARRSSLLALRAPVRALALRRRGGPALVLFGEQMHLERIEESLRTNLGPSGCRSGSE